VLLSQADFFFGEVAVLMQHQVVDSFNPVNPVSLSKVKKGIRLMERLCANVSAVGCGADQLAALRQDVSLLPSKRTRIRPVQRVRRIGRTTGEPVESKGRLPLCTRRMQDSH
jgi:hypothetical protein